MRIGTEALALLDAFDLLVASCRELVAPELVENAAHTGRTARRRLGYLGDSIVVALVGGTGSGKSSLLNALAGEEVVAVSPRRPTTERPVAWIPANPEPGLVRLLDDLGIEDRVGHDRQPWLAVVDLPDVDSLVETHRRRVDDLLPRVDAIVWVLDPEKYQDARLHLDYLAPLVDEERRFVFVLNRIDRVPAGELPALVSDLEAALRVAGFSDPVVLCTAADPDTGLPEGIEAVADELAGRWEAKQLVWENVVGALARSARELAAAAGADGGTGFRSRWDGVLERTVPPLAEALLTPDEPFPWEAADTVEGLIVDVASAVDGDLAVELAGVAAGVAAEVEEAVRVAAAELTSPSPPSSTLGAGLRAVQVAAGLVAGVGLYGMLEALRRSGGVLVPVLLVVAGMLGVGIAGTFARRARERRRRRAVEEQRAGLEDRIRRELDRRLGRPIRDLLRRRAEGGAAYTAFELTLANLVNAEAQPPGGRRAAGRRPVESSSRGAPRRPG